MDNELVPLKWVKLPNEVEMGNIEYKRHLNHLDPHNKRDKFKMIKLSSQMTWRIDEGLKQNGIAEAIYYIGVNDDGSIGNVSATDINDSINILKKVVMLAEAEIVSIDVQVYEKDNHKSNDSSVVAKIVIRKSKNIHIVNEISIALLGRSDHGKSSLLSVLAYSTFDDGDGSARMNIFRYNHEYENGTTSSIKHEIIGYKEGTPINYNDSFIDPWQNIVENSDKIINFIDLPGNTKFIRTTIFGLFACKPNYAMIVVGFDKLSDIPIDNEDDDILMYLTICQKLKIPTIVAVTKCDLKLNDDEYNTKLYKFKADMFDKMNINSLIVTEKDSYTDKECNVIPIIPISNVTGMNYNILHSVIYSLPNKNISDNEEDITNTNFMINEVFYIHNVGVVVVGTLQNGIISLKDKLLIGPCKNNFFNVEIVSIHKKQVPSDKMYVGESGSLVLKFNQKNKINKYMRIIDPSVLGRFINKFYIRFDRSDTSVQNFKRGLTLMAFVNNTYDQIRLLSKIETDTYTEFKVMFCNKQIRFIRDNDSIGLRYISNGINKIVIGHCMIK